MPPGRNDPCACGSGRKFKNCCAPKDHLAALESDRARARYRRGLALERQGRLTEAIAAYRPADGFAPALPEANSRLGHLLLGLGRAEEAARAFRAAANGSTGAERRLDLTRAMMIEKEDVEAEAELRRVLTADPDSSDAWWLLGRILAETGRLDKARAAFERSVALNPKQGAVYYDLVRAYTLSQADRPLVDQMLAAARSVDETDQRIRLQLALGKAFDDLQDYASAMRHFAGANRIKRTLAPFDRQALARRVDDLIEQFTPIIVSSQEEGGDDSELPVFVLGMPRSGTTLVEQILASHREVAGLGEIRFWPARAQLFEEIATAVPLAQFRRRAAKDCLAVLSALAPGAARAVDKNPFNFLWAGLIHWVFPRAVIVHCRRDPIDTCLSIYRNYFAPQSDFSTDPADLVFYYRQYLRLMDHWRRLLPPDRFVEIDYEDLVADPEPASRRLVEACGLGWDPACLRPELNSRPVRSASKFQVRQTIRRESVGRWRRYGPWLGPLAELDDAPAKD